MQQIDRTVDIIVKNIREKILNGTYTIGSKLPAERKLAEELDVNRLTLRSALRHLEAEGFVKPYHGQGVLILDYKTTGNIDLLAYTKDPHHLVDLMNLRKLLAAEAVGVACMEATLSDVNRLTSIYSKQIETNDDNDFLEGDLYFMRTLIHISNSFALRLLFNSFERITRAQKSLHQQIMQNKEQVCSSYRILITLIRNKNETLAKKAVLGYLTPSEEEELVTLLSSR